MNKIVFLLVSSFFLFYNASKDQVPAVPTNKIQQIEAFLAKTLQETEVVPGLGVAIVRGNDIIYQGGFGYRDVKNQLPVTAQTGFYLASTTKSLLGMAAAKLEHQGLLDLNASLASLYPEWEFFPPLNANDIKLTDLLSHKHNFRNSGIPFQMAYINQLPAKEQERILFDFSSVKDAGFTYANTNYNILGAIIEKQTGKPWQTIVEEELLDPLGMQHTTAFMSEALKRPIAYPYLKTADGFKKLKPKADAQMHSAGGHVSTPKDMAHWLLANINEGKILDKEIIPAAVVERAHRPYASLDRNFAFFHRHAYGLGWYRSTYEQDTLIHHFGSFSGYMAHASFMPEHDLGVVVLGNELDHGGWLPHLAAAYIYDVLLGKENLDAKYEALLQDMQNRTEKTTSKIKQRLQKKEALLAEAAGNPSNWEYEAQQFVGTYVNPLYGHFSVYQNSDKALIASFGPHTAPLLPYQKDLFLVNWIFNSYASGPQQLSVQYDQKGKVASLQMQGDEFRLLANGVQQEDLYEVHTAIRVGLKKAIDLSKAKKRISVQALLKKHYPSGALTENTINTFGYRFMAMQELEIALALFEFNTQYYPQSSNVFDSLGEGYLAVGKIEEARRSFQEAIKIDPENKNSIEHLEKLQAE